jgi:hypothetical protein
MELPITPPIFIRSDDLYTFSSKEEAESFMEPVDVERSPGERGYDSEGRLLHVVVRGKVKYGWLGSIDQSHARVELILAEEVPQHREELHTILSDWLGRGNASASNEELATATLEELVKRALRDCDTENRAQTARLHKMAWLAMVVLGTGAAAWWWLSH